MASAEIGPASPPIATDLLSTLRRHWGYGAFRPLQENIVGSLLAGHDTCVVMPTGGGKSLCYQLPAVVMGRTAVVVSPLIALMQDQAAQLAQMGIPAGVLNSSMPSEKQSHVMRQASQGELRLLYLSPERLARADTISWLQNVPIAFFAIDEAHCISEWGHEFRPEYRQLSRLRTYFPDRPIAAFTASATKRVRHDILHQLQLRRPAQIHCQFSPVQPALSGEGMCFWRATEPSPANVAELSGSKCHRLRADHRKSQGDGGFSRGRANLRHRLSRQDGSSGKTQ